MTRNRNRSEQRPRRARNRQARIDRPHAQSDRDANAASTTAMNPTRPIDHRLRANRVDVPTEVIATEVIATDPPTALAPAATDRKTMKARDDAPDAVAAADNANE